MRIRDQEKTVTWDSARKHQRPSRRLLFLLLALPFLLGSLGAAPNAPSAHADELSEARARQSQLKKKIEKQQREVARLNSLQRGLTKDIAATRTELKSINADLVTVKKRITRMKKKIEEVKAAYAALVARGEELDAELTRLTTEEAEKAARLADRKDELALRIRSAYDTDRTSLLETFLSGGSFTDILAEASYMIDVGEQDKALAQQIERDQAALAAVHQTVVETRLATENLRVETAAQKKKLDKSMRDAQEGADQAQEARAGRRARARPPEGRVRADGEEQEGPQEGDRPGPGQPARTGEADRPDHRAAAGAREHPLQVQRQLPLADGRPDQRGVRLQQLSGLWPWLRLCPLPQRASTSWPLRDADSGRRQGHGRVRGLELRRRL